MRFATVPAPSRNGRAIKHEHAADLQDRADDLERASPSRAQDVDRGHDRDRQRGGARLPDLVANRLRRRAPARAK